jgi:hypothetical protein
MFQQINLYQPLFRNEHKLFDATTIAAALAIVAAGLLAIASYSWWRLAQLERQFHSVQAQESEQNGLVARANAMIAQGESQASIEARSKTLALELARRQQALRYLQGDGGQSDTMRASHGFAERMAALAREQVDGLWLTGAVFSSEADGFALTGEALRADLVPLYLQRLAGEAVLAGTKLQSIEIRQPKSPSRGEIAFSISAARSVP